MAKKKNLSDVAGVHLQDPGSVRIAILTSAWNPEVTNALEKGAISYLTENGIKKKNILRQIVPGSFELPLAAQLMFERMDIDGVVCLGCIIQGETRHFEFIAHAVAKGIMEVNLKHNAPVSFGVLTTDTHEQATARAGGKHGNKGVEAAAAVLSMLALKQESEKLPWQV